MKRIILTIILSFSFMLSFAAVPRFTANYYKLEEGKYLDKEVSLRLGSASLSESGYLIKAIGKKGYDVYTCSTVYKGEYGGSAFVIVPSESSKSFYSNFSKGKSTASYKAIMKKKNGKIYFEGM